MVARLWEQQPDEERHAYEAARVYFDLGPERSQCAVATTCHTSRSRVARWSTKHNWRARAQAYDTHRLQVEDAARRRVLQSAAKAETQKWIERMTLQREEEWETARALIAKAREMLASPLEDARWNWRDAATLIDRAARLVRLAEGDFGAIVSESPDQQQVTVRVEYSDEV